MSHRLLLFSLSFATLVMLASRPLTAVEEAKKEEGKAAKAADGPQTAEEKATHEAIIKMRDGVIKAVNDGSLEGLLAHIDDRCVVVWQNGETSRGHEQVTDYYNRMMKGDKARVKSFRIDPDQFKVSEYTLLHGGDTGVAYGTAVCQFELNNGMNFAIDGPWSATVLKNDDEWKIGSFHASVGIFKNPLVAAAQRWFYWGCGIAGVIGFALGFVGLALVRKGRKADS